MDTLTLLAADERYAESVARIMELYWGFEKTRAKILRDHFSQGGNLSSHESRVRNHVDELLGCDRVKCVDLIMNLLWG